jgi:hypothetical protein
MTGVASTVRAKRPHGWRPPRGLLPAVGIVGALLVALVVALPGGGSNGIEDFDDGGGGAGEQVAPTDAGGGGASTDSGGGRAAAPEVSKDAGAVSGSDIAPLPPSPPRQRRFRPGHAQRIERSAALTLAAPSDKLDRVADDIIAVTDRYGGFVLNSSVTSGDDGSQGGDFELRIPADRLRPALRELSELGTVRSRTQSGRDVTAGFVTATDRLQAARAERRGLLDRLEQATTDTQADAIRRRLDIVSAEINRLRGQLRNLRLRTNYAAVSVTLEPDADGGATGGGSGDLGDALDDALGSLAGAMGIGVRALGFAIPLGLVALVVWLATRAYRRRLRESALA